MIRYPKGLVPHGAYQLLKGTHANLSLSAYDDSVLFNLMGGLAIPDYTQPETVTLKKGGLKGLIPPWQTIDHKGATEDGTTFVTALYDPIEVDMTVIARGRDAKHTRRVIKDLIASIDAKKQSELAFTTQEGGRWWAPIRWFKTPPNTYEGAQRRRQELTLRLRADNGFWRTFDDVSSFQFAYEDMTDSFTTDYSGDGDLGPNWPQLYTGTGAGHCTSNGDHCLWVDGANTTSREVVNGPYKDFVTDTDNQVINSVYGSIPEITFPDGAEEHIWGRMGRDGSGDWDGNGIKLQIGWGLMVLSRFNDFTETVMRQWIMLIPPLPGEKFTLVCGFDGNPRLFKVLRNGAELHSFVEVGTGSALGADFRGIGFGMRAAAALITQATPSIVRKISAGDNSVITQSGYLTRLNIGDQPMPDRYTFYGPGTFTIANGPGASDSVTFGPLLANQIVQIRTDNRKMTVVDLTSTPPTPQDLNLFQEALKDLLDFATGNNVPPLFVAIESVFGIAPPQGNLYSLLKGRFSQAAAIPPKSPGAPAAPYSVAVSIAGGNANSRVLAAGTPLRRYPS